MRVAVMIANVALEGQGRGEGGGLFDSLLVRCETALKYEAEAGPAGGMMTFVLCVVTATSVVCIHC